MQHSRLRQPDRASLRLPCITQLLDEVGVYSLDDKDIPFTDSVMSLALATWAAYEAETVTSPVIGGLYGSPPETRIVKETAEQMASRVGANELI